MKTRFLLLALLGSSSYAQTGTFTAAGNMTAPRFNHTATLLPDGKVLIAGGFTGCLLGSCVRPDHAELYDPATGTFTPTGSTTVAYAAGALLLPDGKVLTAGSPGTSSLELYDPSTGEFHTAGNKPATLTGVESTTLLNDGRVLLIGDGAELYDPVSGTFSPVANWPYPFDSSYSSYWFWYPVLLADGKVLLAPNESTVCKIYDPATGTFNLTRAIAGWQNPPATTLLLNGAVLFTGGGDGWLGFAQLYDAAAGTVAALGMSYREFLSATLLPDGTVLVAGGLGLGVPYGPGVPLARAEIYDPATSRFSTTGSLALARHDHTATLLNNGQVLITGGTAWSPSPGTPVNGMSSTELYTPAVLVPAPVLFSTSGDGKGQGAIWHARTRQIATADNPAAAGEALSMYTTSLSDGSVITPQVIVGGRLAQVLFYGTDPGYPGYYQVNFIVPDGVPMGPAVSVRLTYIGRPSNAVTIGVR